MEVYTKSLNKIGTTIQIIAKKQINSQTLSPAEELLPIGEKEISMRLWSQTIPLLFVWTLLYTGHRSQAITKSTK